jgi:hypothetical protein
MGRNRRDAATGKKLKYLKMSCHYLKKDTMLQSCIMLLYMLKDIST